MTDASPPEAFRFMGPLPSWTGLWAKDSALMLVSQGLTLGATSLSAILIARRLEPAEWGIFSAFLGLSFALAIFVEFGLATWLLRELSRLFAEHGDAAERKGRALVGAAVGFAVAMTGLIVVGGTAVSVIRRESPALALALSSLLLYGGLFASCNVLESYLRAQRRLPRVIAASILEKCLLVLLVVLAVTVHTGVWGIGIAYAVAGLFRVSLLGWSVFGWTIPALSGVANARLLLRHSLPFAITSGAFNVVPKLDTLGLLALSAPAAGYFSLGDRIITPATFAPTVAAMTLYPFLARRTHGPRAIWGLSIALSVCGAVVGAAGFFAAPALVPFVFGRNYDAAVPAVRLMVLSLPVIYAASPLLTYAFSYGRERAIVVATMIATSTGTGAILAGQALVGVSGAAAGFLLRQVLLSIAIASIAATTARSQVRVLEPPLPAAAEVPFR